MAPPLLRRLRALIGLALLGALGLPSAAPAQTVDGARAEASRVRAEIEELGRQVSVAAERYNQARERLGGVERSLRDAEHDLASADERMDQARSRVVEAAVLAYMGVGSPAPLTRFTGAFSTDELIVRQQYLRVTRVGHQEVVRELRTATEDLNLVRAQLEQEREEARAAADDAAEREEEARAAQAAHQARLDRVEGELAALIAEEEARLDAEAAEAAEAAVEPATVAEPTPPPEPAPAAEPAPASPPAVQGTSAPTSDAAPSDPGAVAVAEAEKQIGKPYQWGGSGPDTFDCSGLTAWAWKAAGVTLSHSAYLQYTETARVSVEDIRPGDLLFFGPSVKGIHHNAIYVGDGQMIEASQTGVPIRYRGWRSKDLVGIGRPG